MTSRAQADHAAAEATPRPWTIVAALEEELQPLVERTRVAFSCDLDGCRVWRGRIGSTEVVLACTGDGRAAAERGIAAVLERFPTDRLVVVGISGGLSPALVPGAVVVGCRLQDGDVEGPAPAAGFVERLLRRSDLTAATLLTSDRILCTRASKAEAWARLDGDAAALVDLETAAYAAAAQRSGVPWVGLRVVCDPAEEDLPIDFNTCRDREGRVSRARVASRALFAPSALPTLWSLRRRVRTGATRLAIVVEDWLREEAQAHA